MEVLPHTRRVLAAVLAVITLVLATGSASVAASPASGPSTVPAVVNDGVGPQFYGDSVIDITNDVDGDVYAAGQSVTISGDVTGDVIAAAQTITITGNVDGNVRLAGQDVTINGAIARSGTIFASIVKVTDAGSFGGDLVGAAESIVLTGAVGRDVVVGVGSLTIDGTVGGNVTYTSDRDARIAGGAVSGTVERVVSPEPPTVEASPWAMFIGWLLGLLYALVALSLVTALAGLLLPRVLHRVTNHLVPTPWRALLVGFVASIAVPIALVVILVTIIGAPLALAGFLIWLTLTLATFVHVAYYIGRLLFRGDQPPVVKALVGGVILIVALQIPWLNIAVWAAMVLLGLGAQLLAIYDQRPWRRTWTEGEAAPDAPAVKSMTDQGFTETQP
ncbi:cytoskeletal protein CcmA (bactofilin family) [Arthrobacter sp. CAN_A2]|uniref:polymer-forming cytoskeletal protein n=1 Tax=Arthrobacter sp. CAN_A2 TaxID=2787718 RepID=UPI0018EF6E29